MVPSNFSYLLKNIFFSICFGIVLSHATVAQPRSLPATIEKTYQRNFLLLYTLEREFASAVNSSNFLTAPPQNVISKEMIATTKDPASLISSFAWSDSFRTEMGNQVMDYLKKNKRLETVLSKLSASDQYFRFESAGTDSFFLKAWKQDVDGVNYILQAYTTNKNMRYAAIDSTAYPVNGRYYKGVLKEILMQNAEQAKPSPLFNAAHTALTLLDVNNRDEAGRHQPLAKENQETRNALKKIKQSFPYSAILVLGEGPENDFPISANSKLRCQRAAELFHQQKAPVIIISGGYVHPAHTPYAEAVVLKEYMVTELGIPANRILIEPHARHTTTNLRNATRLIYAYGLNDQLPVLCTSGSAHIDYLVSDRYTTASIKTMGYIPARDLKRLTPFEAAFYPIKESLHHDPSDPLDP